VIARLTGVAEAMAAPCLPFFIDRDPGIADPGAGGAGGGITWIEVAAMDARCSPWHHARHQPEGGLMESSGAADVLVVAHRTAATPALLDAIRERAARGPARFHLLVPNPFIADWHPIHPERHEQEKITEAQHVLALALPLFDEAAAGHVDGSVSIRHDPMDAIEEAVFGGDYDEIILSTLPRSVSRWLHVDLPHRVAHLGLPLTTVIARERETADAAG
jgi:hypothetical protein